MSCLLSAFGCVWKCCVPLKPMVLLIIIPFLNGYFIGNIPYFQTNPFGSASGSSSCWCHLAPFAPHGWSQSERYKLKQCVAFVLSTSLTHSCFEAKAIMIAWTLERTGHVPCEFSSSYAVKWSFAASSRFMKMEKGHVSHRCAGTVFRYNGAAMLDKTSNRSSCWCLGTLRFIAHHSILWQTRHGQWKSASWRLFLVDCTNVSILGLGHGDISLFVSLVSGETNLRKFRFWGLTWSNGDWQLTQCQGRVEMDIGWH